ncbi:hypothetical protein [Dyadobacter sp. 676]|uniref:Uncharacterized protein n=1 Tax=Dyadobacter sp. 676 TaxID=3088362 RepID=A0AAU8FLD4_9BACT
MTRSGVGLIRRNACLNDHSALFIVPGEIPGKVADKAVDNGVEMTPLRPGAR